jgi:hypothetical protein
MKNVFLIMTFFISMFSIGCYKSEHNITRKQDGGNNTTLQTNRRNSNSIKDFEWNLSRGGVYITGYKGRSKNVVIPEIIEGNKVIAIDMEAFKNKELTSVVIPEGVEDIWHSAFENNRLLSISIPNSVIAIKPKAFLGNNLKDLNIPDNVKYIGSEAFAHNQLKSYTIGNSITEIGDRAFAFNQLTSVKIPGFLYLGDEIFIGNKVTSITIPEGNFLFFPNTIDPDFYRVYSHYYGNTTGVYTRPNAESTNWIKTR